MIVNSTFTRDSFAAAGLDVGKARVIPLGAPKTDDRGAAGGGVNGSPLRVLWAGSFSIRKGAHHLLAAWKRLAPGAGAMLDIYGAVSLPDKLMRDLPASISVSSTIPHAELFERYLSADVLVFPTLCDGFGMVVTEAFAHGLPVITTNRAGAADLVRHGENGLIVPAGDAGALAGALEWCATHRQDLKAMRGAALDTAARWRWADYRSALASLLKEGLKEAGYRV